MNPHAGVLGRYRPFGDRESIRACQRLRCAVAGRDVRLCELVPQPGARATVEEWREAVTGSTQALD